MTTEHRADFSSAERLKAAVDRLESVLRARGASAGLAPVAVASAPPSDDLVRENARLRDRNRQAKKRLDQMIDLFSQRLETPHAEGN